MALGELASSKSDEEIKDSLADVIVFMAHLCNSLGLDLQEIADIADEHPRERRPQENQVIGKLAHHYLKREQRIRGTSEEHIVHIYNALVQIYVILLTDAAEYSIDLLNAVDETWARVKQRDWKKDAKNGGEATL